MNRPLLQDCPASIRSGFVKKVYSLLTLQLLFTMSVCAGAMFMPSLNMFVVQTPELLYASVVGTFLTLCPLFAYKSRFPWNLCLLLAFTTCEAYITSYICASFATTGNSKLVLYSFAMTIAIFTTLSAYVHFSRRDFKFMEGFLVSCALCLLLISLFRILFPTPGIQLVISCAGVIVFCGFVLYDTSEIVKYMSPDDAIIAAIQLYLDVLNIFIYMLQLLSNFEN